MPGVHAKLSASGAAMWMACPASVRLSQGITETTSVHAAEGTAAHALAEMCLRDGADTNVHLEDNVEGFVVTDEMADAVQIYLDYVRALPGDLRVEERVRFDDYVPEGFGTVDALNLGDDGTIYITDLKYGRGVQVDAENNPQAMCYALGALADYGFVDEFETVAIAIVQPRLDHISEWRTTVAELRTWAEQTLGPAAQVALTDNAPAVPGEKQCRWCRAKGSCRVLADHVRALACEGFGGAEPELLAPDQLGACLDAVPLIKGWIEAVHAHALGVLRRGDPVPGWKMVEGRAQRRWDDETTVEKALTRAKIKAADRFTKKLISPAQAEKLLGKEHALLARHIVRPDGAPTLAPANDKRPALDLDPTAGF